MTDHPFRGRTTISATMALDQWREFDSRIQDYIVNLMGCCFSVSLVATYLPSETDAM